MFDVSAIASIGSSLTSAATLTKAILGMKVDQEVMAKVSALQSEIMSAQSAALSSLTERTSLLEQIDKLEKRLKIKESWDNQAHRYRLTEFPTGVQVYVLRPELADEEPSHRICPNCFQEQRKSILQTISKDWGGEVVDCPSCKLRLVLDRSSP